jgi:hypothetical protein
MLLLRVLSHNKAGEENAKAEAQEGEADKGLLKLPFLLFFLPPTIFTEERLKALPRSSESAVFPDAVDVRLDVDVKPLPIILIFNKHFIHSILYYE